MIWGHLVWRDDAPDWQAALPVRDRARAPWVTSRRGAAHLSRARPGAPAALVLLRPGAAQRPAATQGGREGVSRAALNDARPVKTITASNHSEAVINEGRRSVFAAALRH